MWRKKELHEWENADVRDFIVHVLPGHECVTRFNHTTGKVLGSLIKEDLRLQARDEEATNVIWAELNRLRNERMEHDSVAAHGDHPFTIFVRTPMDNTLEIEVQPTETTLAIKKRLASLEGTSVENQRLVWSPYGRRQDNRLTWCFTRRCNTAGASPSAQPPCNRASCWKSVYAEHIGKWHPKATCTSAVPGYSPTFSDEH